jgi:hypothetical protein
VPTGASANNTTACTFAVQAINCDFVIGRQSNPILVLLDSSNNILNNAHSNYNKLKASIALAFIFAAGFIVSIAALVTIVVITCYQKRVSVSVVKRDSTPELATPVATDLDLDIPIYENNETVMESSLNTGENIAYSCAVYNA